MCVHVSVVYICVCACVKEYRLQESVLAFFHMGPGD